MSLRSCRSKVTRERFVSLKSLKACLSANKTFSAKFQEYPQDINDDGTMEDFTFEEEADTQYKKFYEHIKSKLSQSWANIQPKIYAAYVESFVSWTNTCSQCGIQTSNICRCFRLWCSNVL